MLKLVSFRTTDFRSITDSGWIDVDDVTALVGVNESGKTNIMLSLWKLKPAREGAIDPIKDFPRDRYNEIRSMETKPIFITARFQIPNEIAREIAELTDLDPECFSEVEVSRRLSEQYLWSFPHCEVRRSVSVKEVLVILDNGIRELEPISPFQMERNLKEEMLGALQKAKAVLGPDDADEDSVAAVQNCLEVDRQLEAKSSKLRPIFDDTQRRLESLARKIDRPEPTKVEGVWDLVFSRVPKFVFYSTYGNLDSEIYLPHVIHNLDRGDLGEREAAKSRTLRVLFEFVDLSPNEILALGTETIEPEKLTASTIERDARKKKEREILLTSASTQLTNKFRNWWKQGNYRFRFDADGNHFRIWVSDDDRPEEVELEGRSTGLQWFFSFYLVFLVESTDEHEGTVLLLDEAGLSLHPLAQRDLSAFFEGLPNQILYTTHSPFLLEPDALERVRSVFLDVGGRTVVSADLRASMKEDKAKKSVYAVHVALGLSVSDTFLLGCIPVIVEGPSDQRYLTAIKNFLVGKKLIAPASDLVFLPAGGTGIKGVSAVVSVVAARDDDLPSVLLDSDQPGDNLKSKLISGVYRGQESRVRQVSDYGVFKGGEIEDLIPSDVLSRIITRYLPRPAGSDEEFDEIVDAKRPIVNQVEQYAVRHGVILKKGWKVDIATAFKNRLGRLRIDERVSALWASVFEDILNVR